MSWIENRCVLILSLYLVSVTSADDVYNHAMWKWLDEFACGENAADRIIGGYTASLGQFPWIARLGYTVDYESTNATNDSLDWMCGGSLITDRHIVTAGHCVQPSDYGVELVSVRLGEYDTRKDPDCQKDICAPPYQDRKISKIITHPKYNEPFFHNDIALLEMDKPIELNDYVLPICLPKREQSDEAKIGELLTVAGWGKVNVTTEERANVLQYVQVPVLNGSECNLFGKSFNITSGEICAGAQQNKDTCGGDSGGPLMKVFDTPEGPKTFLVGLVSFGPTVCGIKKPGVYSSIRHFLPWLLSHLKKI